MNEIRFTIELNYFNLESGRNIINLLFTFSWPIWSCRAFWGWIWPRNWPWDNNIGFSLKLFKQLPVICFISIGILRNKISFKLYKKLLTCLFNFTIFVIMIWFNFRVFACLVLNWNLNWQETRLKFDSGVKKLYKKRY